MHNKIMDIQKSFERAYIEFSRTDDMEKYNSDLDDLFKRYQNEDMMSNFCSALLVAWAPIVNDIKNNPENQSRIKIIKG